MAVLAESGHDVAPSPEQRAASIAADSSACQRQHMIPVCRTPNMIISIASIVIANSMVAPPALWRRDLAEKQMVIAPEP
jgi:hypothetical protein